MSGFREKLPVIAGRDYGRGIENCGISSSFLSSMSTVSVFLGFDRSLIGGEACSYVGDGTSISLELSHLLFSVHLRN
jgi:hypothetical protein